MPHVSHIKQARPGSAGAGLFAFIKPNPKTKTMNHLLQHNPNPCQPLQSRRRKPEPRILLMAALAGLITCLSSCSESRKPEEPPAVPVTDTRPVGDGLKIIGYSLLGGCVVIVMGRILTR